HDRGWQVTGMDMSPHAVEQAKRHFGLDVVHGTLPHPAIAANSFEVITMGAVLEHLHWPHRVIAAAARALKPGGRLVISVPNFASWGYRFFGADWWPLELPRHLLHFTPATLRLLVEAHGLKVTELRMLGRTGWMRRSLAAWHGRVRARKNEIAAESPRSRSSTLSRSQRFLASFGTVRMIQSGLTRWRVGPGQAVCLLLIARRAGPAATPLHQAA